MRASCLAAVAAHGLAGSRLELPMTPLPPDGWAQLLRAVTRQRLPGFLLRAVADGALAVTEEQEAQAVEAHRRSMHLALVLERLLLDTSDRLRAAAIDHRVLKGPAYAHLVYPDPALRSFGDIDVLVPGQAYDDAVAVLEEAGARRRVPELAPGFDRRFGKGATFVTPAGIEIDLHRTFVFGPFGLDVRLADLFATATPFVVGGRRLLALGPEEQLLHACFHAALGSPSPRLLALRDVAQMALDGALDFRRLERLCVAWRCHAVVAAAVRSAWDVLAIADALPISEWARAYRPQRREEAALRLYTSRQSYLAQAVASLSALDGMTAKAVYVGSLGRAWNARRRGRAGRMSPVLRGARFAVARLVRP